ncbi:hypothetical protein H8L32_21140 [Undibacterium sp. CY18W]|uniref:Uncharacterized protein n=1 Tax=Undibacterium hunanense TaxID=2762292 RepID=A0ABR6ZW13_9BURK|nr:hypothetical protein [Undibacterium hunanense]MBC3919989.1 hypothetical protein [Undibacterium hunanense]
MNKQNAMTPEQEKKIESPPVPNPQHKEKKENALDEALDESFPASDPVAVSITPPSKKT